MTAKGAMGHSAKRVTHGVLEPFHAYYYLVGET